MEEKDQSEHGVHDIDVWEATWMGDLGSIKDLSQKYHVNLNIREKLGMSPLHYAAGYCQQHFVAALLDHGSDVNAVDDFGKTPLHWALSMDGDLPVIESLVDRGAGYAQGRGGRPNIPVIKLLIEHGAAINAVDNNGTSFLHIAVEKGRGDIVTVLVESGANVIIENSNGETPLDKLYTSRNKLDKRKFDAVEDILAPRERIAMKKLRDELKEEISRLKGDNDKMALVEAKVLNLEERLRRAPYKISALTVVTIGIVFVAIYLVKFEGKMLGIQ